MQALKRRGTIVAGIGGIGAAVVLGLALVGGPAQAEDPAPSASSSAPAAPAAPGAPAAPAAPGDRPDRAADRTQRQDELAGALATELGIDKAKVAAALEKVQAAQQAKAKADRAAQMKTRLDEAVKAGKITSEQAAAILKASEAGVLGLGGPGGGPGGKGGGRHGGGGFGGR